MASFNATNGIISARVAKISNSGDSALLVLPGTGAENALGMVGRDQAGWVKFNPAKMPAVGIELEIPCASVSVRKSEYANADGELQTSSWLEFE